MNPERLAIRLMIAQAAFFAAETALIHRIGTSACVAQLALLRGGGGLILAFVCARHAGIAVARTCRLSLQLARGGVSLLYLWIMVFSFAHLPFADATAISYTQAAYIALFSWPILGETVSAAGWGAVGMSLAGAMLIIKPSFAGWNAVYLAVFLGTSLNGLAFVLNRHLQREDSEATTMFYTNLVAILGNLPALALGGLPSPDALAWLPALLILGPLGMYAGIVAVRHASASMLAPYTLLRLVIGTAGGVVIFGETPAASTVVGIILVLASCVVSGNSKLVLTVTRSFQRLSLTQHLRTLPHPRRRARTI